MLIFLDTANTEIRSVSKNLPCNLIPVLDMREARFNKSMPGAKASISRHDTKVRQAPALCVPTERVYTFTTEQTKS